MKKLWIIAFSVVLVTFAVIGFVDGAWSKGSLPPISISWRVSALDSSGLVMQVQNTSNERLSCKMGAYNATQGQTTIYSFDLGPYKMSEIGPLECNWVFQHGESVGIRVEGYAEDDFKVP